MPEPDDLAPQPDGGVAARPERRPFTDGGALALLAAMLFLLPALDGGRSLRWVAVLGALVVLGAPAARQGILRASRPERWLLAVFGVALFVHPFVTDYRDGIATELVRYAAVPMVYLTARYVVVRWPHLLPAVIPVAGLWMWLQGWGGWFDPPEALFAAWRAVPWHNPSGILMGALLAYATTMVLATRRIRMHVPLAIAAASGLFLSGSRAAMALSALAVVVLVGLHARSRGDLLWLVAIVVGATVLSAGLLALSPSYREGGLAVLEKTADPVEGIDTPLGARSPDASGNARARLLHMQTALRMFERSPATGTGLGSYGHYVLDLAEPRMNFTRSAHNEPLEVLGEGGLLVGVPFAMLFVATVYMLAVAVFRPGLASTGRAGAAAAGLILAHTLFDVDWAYLSIMGFAAVVVAVARVPRPPRMGATRFDGLTPVIALVLPVVLGLTLIAQRSMARDVDEYGWWESEPHVERAAEALSTGSYDVAVDASAAARAAGPGDLVTTALGPIVERAVRGDEVGLYAIATDPDTPLSTARLAVAALEGMDPAAARRAADAIAVRLEDYHPSRIGEVAKQIQAGDESSAS